MLAFLTDIPNMSNYRRFGRLAGIKIGISPKFPPQIKIAAVFQEQRIEVNLAVVPPPFGFLEMQRKLSARPPRCFAGRGWAKPQKDSMPFASGKFIFMMMHPVDV